ncbi:MAG: hypothetical protein M1817_003659 [Caeruleum heppii]|nr:MAG: hypothetical protein M1817_003659 [Caeruleum heppii]
MSDSVDRVFVHALNTVKKIPRTGSGRPPPSERLKLYGLYKQSMEGDVDGVMERPAEESGEEGRAERDKWDAWHSHKGLSRTEAKRRYVSTLIDTMHHYASTTPDARELVAELEFVWDQIRSNVPSSSSSSPPQHLLQSSVYPAFSGVVDPEQRLRVLRPSSQDDDEQEDDNDDDGDEDDDAPRDATNNPRDGPPSTHENPDSALTLLRKTEARTRKWRRRVEGSLLKMTAEVAALREQMEGRRLLDGQRKKGFWRWFVWLLWRAVKHVLVDLLVVGVVVVWMRRKREGPGRMEGKVREGIRGVGEYLERLRWR